MTLADGEPSRRDLDLVRCGPTHRLATLLGIEQPGSPRRVLRILLLLLVTWAPLAALSLKSGHCFGEGVKKPFSHDPEVHSRLLVAVPLLELAELLVAVSLVTQVRYLGETGIIPQRETKRFEGIKSAAARLRETWLPEGAILALACGVSLIFRLAMGINEGESSWDRIGSTITAAGWWHLLVSLPVLYFLLFRLAWVFVVWSVFLFCVSRLDLALTPTHPDRTGGLGFLGWGLTAFGTVVVAYSTVFAAGFANEILHGGASLESLKYHAATVIVTALVILHLPLLAFSGRLARCRFQGMLDFGALAWRHDHEFDEKWMQHLPAADKENLLGNHDFTSLASVAASYEHVNRIRLVPFDAKAFVVLVLAGLIPMIPLIGTAIPLREIFVKLGELLV